MGSLIIHVGPPKTASTSLQVAAEQLDLKGYIYGGVNQPRSRNKMSLAHKLHLACASTQAEDWDRGNKTAKEIRAKCAQGYTVLVSEEMFMVHQQFPLSC